MKSSRIRFPNKRTSTAKKPKTKNRKTKREKVYFVDSDTEPPAPEPEAQPVPEPPSDYELPSDHENEGETVDEIHEFIRESDQALENLMPVDPVNILPPAGENKKGKRQTVLEAKMENLEKKLETFAYDLKGIKDLLKIRSSTSKNTGQIAAYCKEACVFPLLPKFQLKKVAYVNKMELDIHADAKYKEQLVHKMSLFGGRTVKAIVINIFKKMFTAKLKAKFCWTGSTKGKGKDAFQKFDGIISAIHIATSAHVDCTITEIEEECKLRFKQAPKDYSREKDKKRMEKQRLERLALEMDDMMSDE